MSKKLVNGEEMYSFESMVEKALFSTSKKTIYDFINFLVSVDIVNRKAVRYRDRVNYVYTPSAWFDVLMDGRIYREPKKYKEEILNGTLFFDEFSTLVLARLYRQYKIAPKRKKDFDIMLYKTISQAALELIPTPLNLQNEVGESVRTIEPIVINEGIPDQQVMIDEWEKRKNELRTTAHNNIAHCVNSMASKKKSNKKR